MRFLLAMSLLLGAIPAFAERWRMQYFHDKLDEEFNIQAIGFCSPTHGVATGFLQTGKKRTPVSLVTANGGSTWSLTNTKEAGHALHFVDQTAGWMITESGIWYTEECGRTWLRVKKQRGLTDVYFVSPEHGWATGAEKKVLETRDAGKTWTPVAAAEDVKLTADQTVYWTIGFANEKTGIIAGRSHRTSTSRLPLWLDPNPWRYRERPSLTVLLETKDGGTTWKSQTSSMFGKISRLELGKNGLGLALMEFEDYFDYFSELVQVNTRDGSTKNSLRRKDFAITDVLVRDESYAAGYLPPGVLRSPIPGQVRIARSKDGVTWLEDTVDYRAVATRVRLAESGGQAWAATDTGMILKLEK